MTERDPRKSMNLTDPRRIATQIDFARELTSLKERAGLTVRQVAHAAGLPTSTIGDYFAGRHLPSPSQPDLLSGILRACGEQDPAQIDRWLAALRRARRAPGRRRANASSPYRGLASFQPEDAGWFFGREALTRLLVSLITGPAVAAVPLAVVGPSGSGKSSLLRAGLIPALSRSNPVPQADGQALSPVLLTPGATPVETLAACLTATGDVPDTASRLRSDPGNCMEKALPPVIVVDQFEEVFTACQVEEDTRSFVRALSALASGTIVVLGLRADFYGQALRYPELAAALQYRQVVVRPMTQEQLRCVIVEPARRAKVEVEDGLVELLLRELAPATGTGDAYDAGHEPGALPLLSHALLATWERSRGSRLTVADYRASGGIRDAIARTAEAVYQALDDPERDEARRLFLRLVRVTDEATQTRCRVPVGELAGSADSAATSYDVLGRFVDQRLITVSEENAEISHETLLDAWPRLQAWIETGRDGLRIRRRIDDGARIWLEARRDEAALPRGGQLAIAREWAADPMNRDSLSSVGREFVDAGIARDHAERESGRRRTRRLRQLVAALTVLVLTTAGLTGYALLQREAANTARDDADSQELASEAAELRGQDVSVSAQLSLAAYQTARTPDAAASVLESSGTPVAARIIDSAGVVQAVAISPDHRTLAAAASDGTLRLWNVGAAGRPFSLGPALEDHPHSPLYTVAFRPNGQLLAAAGASKTVRLWNVSNPRHPFAVGRPLGGPTKTVYSVAFSPNGNVLAAGSADGTIRLWDMADPSHARPLATLSQAAGAVEAVTFSPDGRILAAAYADTIVRLWNVADPQHPVMLGAPLTGPAKIVTSVAFSPSGDTLAAGSQDNNVWLWNVSDPVRPVRRAPLTGATDFVNAVAFSPNGATLAAGSSDNTVRLWNLATGSLIGTLPDPDIITSLAWNNENLLTTGGADGVVRLWTLPPPVLTASGPVNSIAFRPSGSVLAVGGSDLELWDLAKRSLLAARDVNGTFVNAVAFAPGGAILATGYGNGHVQLWNVAHGSFAPVGPPMPATANGMVESVAFSPDGQVLASGGDDGTVRLWDVRDPAHPVSLKTIDDSGTIVFSVAFSAKGHIFAAASADNLTRLWDVTDPARPRRLGKPLAGPTNYALSVAFSPDGHILAVGSADETLRLWNVAHPARPRLIGVPLTGLGAYVYSVAFSPDGQTLAAGVTDGKVWMWTLGDPGHPALIATLTGPTGHVYSVAFSPDGRTLAAGSADSTVRLWDTDPAAAAAAICATAGESLTRTEWAAYAPERPYAPPCPGH
jgi:WD40 repeat protein